VLQFPDAHEDELSLSEGFAVANAEKSFLVLTEPHLGHVTSSWLKEDL